ncbi:lanthionine synthetase C family protein [Streptomyces sp. NPDC052811]|uniref:lanthionine synthetase C family protein n=1 Tax=Streptomyces sp. NPDC052811 TaxID=3155731 RepID=UPI00341685E1
MKTWRSVLDPQRRADALATAREVIVRVTDPERLSAAIEAAGEQTWSPQTFRWRPCSVAEGEAGLAVLCAYAHACLPEEGWDVVAHDYLRAAVRGAERESGVACGLFEGVSGLAFVASALSRDGERYSRLLASLDAGLAPQASALGERLRLSEQAVPVSYFDVISGASGVGAYLLRRDVHRVLPNILTGLVSLAEPQEAVPRWWTPPYLIGDESTARLYPQGLLNCGLAHGVPGPLALLALALNAGVEVRGQRSAVRTLADWIVSHRVDGQWGLDWPSVVPIEPADGAPLSIGTETASSRTAWCYGSPGVARSLWSAGQALDDQELCQLALEAMSAVLRRPVHQRGIESPTLCHGISGLLQIVLRFWHDTNHDVFSTAARDLVDLLLTAYDPERYLAFASLGPGSLPVDRPGLLDGAAGVAITLLAASTNTEPSWDRLFLMS